MARVPPIWTREDFIFLRMQIAGMIRGICHDKGPPRRDFHHLDIGWERWEWE